MDTIIEILMLLTAILGIVGLIWGVIAAFEKSLGWGLVALILAPAGVIAFLVMTWRDNYKPLALIGGALLLGITAVLLMGAQYGAL